MSKGIPALYWESRCVLKGSRLKEVSVWNLSFTPKTKLTLKYKSLWWQPAPNSSRIIKGTSAISPRLQCHQSQVQLQSPPLAPVKEHGPRVSIKQSRIKYSSHTTQTSVSRHTRQHVEQRLSSFSNHWSPGFSAAIWSANTATRLVAFLSFPFKIGGGYRRDTFCTGKCTRPRLHPRPRAQNIQWSCWAEKYLEPRAWCPQAEAMNAIRVSSLCWPINVAFRKARYKTDNSPLQLLNSGWLFAAGISKRRRRGRKYDLETGWKGMKRRNDRMFWSKSNI